MHPTKYNPNEVEVITQTVTGPYTLPRGAVALAVLNYGGAAGTFEGKVLPDGAAINWQFDPPLVVPKLEFDGTGTTLLVTAAYKFEK